MENPILSICIVSYNQEKYIEECLNSLFSQDIPCPFEVIISDDNSTDKTKEILKLFATQYPNIRLFLHETNKGALENYLFVHRQAKGIYVSHMDGDDVALPGKYKTQLELFKTHPWVGVCWHKVEVFSENSELTEFMFRNLPKDINQKNITIKDLLKYGTLGAHSSLIYKRELFDYNKFVSKTECIDYYFAVQYLKKTQGAYIDEILGKYRRNSGQISLRNKILFGFKIPWIQLVYINHLDEFIKEFPQYRTELFLNSLSRSYVDFKKLRWTFIKFLYLSIKSFTIKGLFEIPYYIQQARRMKIS